MLVTPWTNCHASVYILTNRDRFIVSHAVRKMLKRLIKKTNFGECNTSFAIGEYFTRIKLRSKSAGSLKKHLYVRNFYSVVLFTSEIFLTKPLQYAKVCRFFNIDKNLIYFSFFALAVHFTVTLFYHPEDMFFQTFLKSKSVSSLKICGHWRQETRWDLSLETVFFNSKYEQHTCLFSLVYTVGLQTCRQEFQSKKREQKKFETNAWTKYL